MILSHPVRAPVARMNRRAKPSARPRGDTRRSSFTGPKPWARILPGMDRASVILTAIALAAVIASVLTFTPPGRQFLQSARILGCQTWDCRPS
jgi:hypothetical protein